MGDPLSLWRKCSHGSKRPDHRFLVHELRRLVIDRDPCLSCSVLPFVAPQSPNAPDLISPSRQLRMELSAHFVKENRVLKQARSRCRERCVQVGQAPLLRVGQLPSRGDEAEAIGQLLPRDGGINLNRGANRGAGGLGGRVIEIEI